MSQCGIVNLDTWRKGAACRLDERRENLSSGNLEGVQCVLISVLPLPSQVCLTKVRGLDLISLPNLKWSPGRRILQGENALPWHVSYPYSHTFQGHSCSLMRSGSRTSFHHASWGLAIPGTTIFKTGRAFTVLSSDFLTVSYRAQGLE